MYVGVVESLLAEDFKIVGFGFGREREREREARGRGEREREGGNRLRALGTPRPTRHWVIQGYVIKSLNPKP